MGGERVSGAFETLAVDFGTERAAVVEGGGALSSLVVDFESRRR